MSPSKEIAALAMDHIEDMLAEMFESGETNNRVLLGSLGNKEVIQVQLIVTRDQAEFMDDC